MCLDLSEFMIHGFTVSAKQKKYNKKTKTKQKIPLGLSFQLKKGKKNNLMTTQAKKLLFWLAFKYHKCPLDIIIDMSV